MIVAKRIRVRGVVQGVGYRPFVFRLAERLHLCGWVRNDGHGVAIHVEGERQALNAFVEALSVQAPAAAQVTDVTVEATDVEGWPDFTIRESAAGARLSVQLPTDLAVCPDCLKELFDAADRRYLYPYVNCTACGPRYTVIERLPYDRPYTTMKDWNMCPACAAEYQDPADRRFHAQPNACPVCGPHYVLYGQGQTVRDSVRAVLQAAQLLRDGFIVAVKGLGGYHLACDAENPQAVERLRRRKRRPAKPFAVMVKDLDTARTIVELSAEEEALLSAPSRPIVLARARRVLPGVAPDNTDLGVMLPYTPLHYLLFYRGAPSVMVMTSGNRSGEPIVYDDEDALTRLADVCDAWLVGERPIARRVDDSVCRVSAFGATFLRRARGAAPLPVAKIPTPRPILAVGSDLKNTITLAVNGQAVMSQHLGDLEQYEAFTAFEQTVRDLLAMYRVPPEEVTVVSDLHPDYHSTRYARQLPALRHMAVQHHQAHVASVLAERHAWERRVIGVAFDGTGYGDDGTIWGGEWFAGSLGEGLRRCGHLRPALLPGGDAAAKVPLQALAGFFADRTDWAADVGRRLAFPERFFTALKLAEKQIRTFPSTSVGRLFDAVAALLGFTEPITFEGQAAIWLEHRARSQPLLKVYPFPWDAKHGVLDYRPLLEAMVEDRLRGEAVGVMARAFHRSVAEALFQSVQRLGEAHGIETLVLSGGVFQNALLLSDVRERFAKSGIDVWIPHQVPANDGGISLGQAALAATVMERAAVEKEGT